MKIVISYIAIGHLYGTTFRPVIYNIGQKSLETTQFYNNRVKNLRGLHPTEFKKG